MSEEIEGVLHERVTDGEKRGTIVMVEGWSRKVGVLWDGYRLGGDGRAAPVYRESELKPARALKVKSK